MMYDNTSSKGGNTELKTGHEKIFRGKIVSRPPKSFSPDPHKKPFFWPLKKERFAVTGKIEAFGGLERRG